MWTLLRCYLSGGHDYGIACASGVVFLRCIHCGRRSIGWEVISQGARPAAHVEGTAPSAAPASPDPHFSTAISASWSKVARRV